MILFTCFDHASCLLLNKSRVFDGSLEKECEKQGSSSIAHLSKKSKRFKHENPNAQKRAPHAPFAPLFQDKGLDNGQNRGKHSPKRSHNRQNQTNGNRPE